jgi:tetratricopeptide (TPR) repeat protein
VIDQTTPEQDAAVAAHAIMMGHLAHATYHLGCALSSDPQNPAWRTMLDGILVRVADPLALVPLERDLYFATAAVRAYIHASLNQHLEALRLLTQVCQVTPDLRYLPWLAEWLRLPGALAAIPADTIVTLFGVILSHHPGDAIADEQAHQHLNEFVPALHHILATYPQDSTLASLASMMLRKLGQHAEALRLAQAAYQLEPSWQTAVSLALAHRARGEAQAALAAYQMALGHAPDDLSVRLDIADLLCSEGHILAGQTYYQEVLERKPDHSWARPHWLYYQFWLTGEPRWQEQLLAYAAANPDNERAALLAQALADTLTPYVGYLPAPADALVNLIHQFDQTPAAQALSSVALSALEAPSARLVLDRYAHERFGAGPVQVEIAALQQPDPRQPRAPVDYLLWRYEGTDPLPNVAPPAPQVADAVAALAASPYHLARWWQVAQGIAANLGVTSLPDLLGVMAHPPTRNPETPLWDWVARVQIAAALIIGALDEGWEGTLRQRVLFSLANGPMDWSVSAAVLALSQVALEEPTATLDILRLFLDMLSTIPGPGYCPYVYPLLCATLRLPDLPPDLQASLQQWKEELEA